MSNHERGGPNLHPQRSSPDDALTDAWRDASDELPSSERDAAILAAARQSVAGLRVEPASRTNAAPAARSRPPSRFKRWQPLAVAASVVGLAFALVQTLPREPEFLPPERSSDSVSTPAVSPQPQPKVTAAPDAGPAPAGKPLAQEKVEARDVASAQRAVPAPPHEPSTPTPIAETAPPGDGAAEVPSSNGAAAATDTAAVAAPAHASAAKAVQRLDTADWAASIEAQYAAGDVAGAADRLRAFRAIEPAADQYLPDTLRAWARSVE